MARNEIKRKDLHRRPQRSQRVGDKSHVTEKSIRNKLFEVFEIFCANSPGSQTRFRTRVGSAPPMSRTIFGTMARNEVKRKNLHRRPQRSQRVGDESHVTEKSIRNKLFEVFEIFCANSPGSQTRF